MILVNVNNEGEQPVIKVNGEEVPLRDKTEQRGALRAALRQVQS